MSMAAGITCVLLAAICLWIKPAKFEATASLTMAHVLGAPVETSLVLVEKIKSGTYFSPSAWAACGVDDSSDPGRKLADKIHPVSNRNAPFIGLSVTGNTTDGAMSCLALVIAEISAAQDALSRPTLAAKRGQLEEMRQSLVVMKASDNAAEKLQSGTGVNQQQFAIQTLWLSAAIARREVMRDLHRQIVDLEINLSAPLTHPSRLVSPIYAPPIPAGPPAAIILLCVFLAGVLLCGGLIWLRWAAAEQNPGPILG